MKSTRRQFLLASGLGLVAAACTAARRRLSVTPATGATSASVHPHATGPAPTAPSARRAGPARFVRSGPADGHAIALTFHGSGDVGLLHALLAAAERTSAPVTIFAVGSWLDANPGVAREIEKRGHELANHTYTHPPMAGLDSATVLTEITRGRDALARHAGAPGAWFRPSGVTTASALILEEAGRAGYATVVGFDVDPLDYQDPGADLIVRRVTSGLHPGAIVSLHTGHAGTVAAFERMVAGVRSQGLHPTLVRDLLG